MTNKCAQVNKRISINLFILFALLVFSKCSYAATYEWNFSNDYDFNGWSSLSVEYLNIEDNHLIISSSSVPRLISPVNLGISAKKALRIRIISQKDWTLAFGLQTRAGQILKRFKKIKTGEDDYDIYFDNLKEGDIIDAFVMDFQGIKEVKIEYIKFYDPSLHQLLYLIWDGFWAPELNKTPIAYVTTPKIAGFSLSSVLYIIIAICFAGFVFYFYNKIESKKNLLTKAVIYSFIVSSIAYATRMDYNWYKMIENDVENLGNTDIPGRISILYDGYGEKMPDFFHFINFLKTNVPDKAMVRPAARPPHSSIPLIAKYFLLPIRTSEKAEYLWIFNEEEIVFDENAKSLKNGDVVIASPVRLIAQYKQIGALFLMEELQK